MKHILLFAVIVTMALTSCKKENTNTTEQPLQESVLDYYPLAVGNYWLYAVSSCDSTWTVCNPMRIDSNYISKDTVMNGLTYFKIEGQKISNSDPWFVRDSLDYIVDEKGSILFSNTDFETILYEEYVVGNPDTLYHWYYKMDPVPFVVSVPVGEFTCLDNKMSFFRINEQFQHEFNAHSAFAKYIGPVYQQAMFASSTGGMKRELVGYKVLPEQVKMMH